MSLSKEQREKLQEIVFQSCMDNMFGDGLEADYIRDGISFKGINHMTDEELIEEAGISGFEDVDKFLADPDNFEEEEEDEESEEE